MVKLYVAGPMTGLPDLNYPAFQAAEAALRAAGYDVVNPARPGLPPDTPWDDCMRRGISDVLTVEGVAVLPGWEKSRGAKLEALVADALGLRILTLEMWLGLAVLGDG